MITALLLIAAGLAVLWVAAFVVNLLLGEHAVDAAVVATILAIGIPVAVTVVLASLALIAVGVYGVIA
ncbi:MAG: hypothetical protein HZY75_13130 [Nocardioidaceae bacterium]|nr:MAG: hypothetical protein HZY75_13130 [Nocardioidaceae bacterium]